MTKYEELLLDLNLNKLSIKTLAALYNELTGSSIKKFENSAKGEARVRPLLEDKIAQEALAKEVKPKAEKVKGERKVSISGKCQELILAGKTDAEIFAELQALNLITDEKKQKSYPAWNRATMKRKGQI